MSQSEIARIREQITREYESVQQIFGGFTSTAKHEIPHSETGEPC